MEDLPEEIEIKKHGPSLIIPGFALLIVIIGAVIGFAADKTKVPEAPIIVEPSVTPTPKYDQPFGTYSPPVIENKPVYQIFLIGDSMTNALGPHGGTFNDFINDIYKPLGKEILIDNYGAGAKNILDLKEMMNVETVYWDSTFAPLLSRDVDLILIESFGYNPLSQYPMEEGLKKQTAALDEVMNMLTDKKPQSAIVFVATIAPSKTKYALPVNKTSTLAERSAQAQERIAYINNHIAYAGAHGIPLINIFEKSLTANGDGNLKYINPNDYIHPSFAGVDFIGHELADFIYTNAIFPL